MGRKSLAEERTEQILDAFERCIVKYGYEGSSLEKIAEEAGVKRSIIRHYIGNREELTEALLSRIMKEEADMTEEAQTHLSAKDLRKSLLDFLFLSDYDVESKHIEILLKALWYSAEKDERIRKLLHSFYQQGELEIRQSLEIIYPNAKQRQLDDTAFALLCLTEGLDNTLGLGFGKDKAKAIKRAAETLLKNLES